MEQLASDLTEYINLRFKALKLSAVEHLATLLSSGFGVLLFLLLISMTLFFFAVAFILWLGSAIGSYVWALVIVGAFFLLLSIVAFVLRDRVIVNALVRRFCQMFFGSDRFQHDDEDENK